MCIFFSFLPPVFPASLLFLLCRSMTLLAFSYWPCSLYFTFSVPRISFFAHFWNFLQYTHIICKWGHSLSSFPPVNFSSCLTSLPSVFLFIFQSSIILVCTSQFTHFFFQSSVSILQFTSFLVILCSCYFRALGNCWLWWAMRFLGLISRDSKPLTFGKRTKRPYFPLSPPPAPGFNTQGYRLPAFIFPEARITHLRTF